MVAFSLDLSFALFSFCYHLCVDNHCRVDDTLAGTLSFVKQPHSQDDFYECKNYNCDIGVEFLSRPKLSQNHQQVIFQQQA